MSDEYSKENIKVIPLPDSVRKRPGMFFGNINSLAVNAAIYEAVANAVDQYLAGNATKVSVDVEGKIIRVLDDGSGLPFNRLVTQCECSNLAEHYFIHHHDSPTADNHAPHIHIIGGGLGLAVLNAAAERIKVKSSNGVHTYSQVFGRGKIISPGEIKKIRSAPGTELEIELDADLFQGYQPDFSAMRKTLFELAHFYPGLVVEFQQERFVASRGLLDLAYIQYSNPPLAWAQDPPVKYFLNKIKDQIQIQVAAIGDSKTDTTYKSWVNGVETVEGGAHVVGLSKAFENVSWMPRVAFIHLIMHDPKFAGPSKDALRSSLVENIIEKAVTESLIEFRDNNACQ
ncbi:MAG: hypothetical protein U1F46_08195 [Marinagarivorans sp.]